MAANTNQAVRNSDPPLPPRDYICSSGRHGNVIIQHLEATGWASIEGSTLVLDRFFCNTSPVVTFGY